MVTTQGPQVIEKSHSGMQGLPEKLVEVVDQMQSGMEEKGQQIEHQKNLGEMLGTMAEVVFDVVAFPFQDIDALVLNLPAGAAKVTDIFCVASREGVVGDPTVVIQDFASCLMGDEQIAPVNQQGIVTAADGHLIDPLPTPPLALFPIPPPL
jgi:hypothetical protein